jgi:hypothetical protein
MSALDLRLPSGSCSRDTPTSFVTAATDGRMAVQALSSGSPRFSWAALSFPTGRQDLRDVPQLR